MITSVEEFVRLRLSQDPVAYNRANYDEAPREVWLGVYRQHPDLATYIAFNESAVSLDVLEILARDPDGRVRYALARRKDLSLSIVEFLAYDHDESVRCAVIHSPHVTSEVLKGILAIEWFEPNIEAATEKLAALAAM